MDQDGGNRIKVPPTVSVLMTVFNGEAFLRQAIDSVLAQTYDDWELIVVDDASVDSTPEILMTYRDPRVRVLRQERNCKQAVCSNLAISVAKGRYMARLDADDICLPTRLEEQVRYMDAHPETHLVATAAYFIDDRGVRVGLCPALRGTCDLKISMALYNPIIHSSVMFRADTARELNGYSEDERHRLSEDYELWPRIARCGKITTLSEPLVEYRFHPSSVSAVNPGEQNQQGASIARANLERILGREVDEITWAAWWRFRATKPGCMVTFDAVEVTSLHLLVSGLIRGVQHDRGGQCKLPLIWAKHALALALLRRGDIGANARLRLLFMGAHIGTQALIAHW